MASQLSVGARTVPQATTLVLSVLVVGLIFFAIWQ